MTAPALTPTEQDLVELLGLVDVSRSRSIVAENLYRADVAAVYAQQSATEDDSAPLVSATLLAAAVTVIRRALAAGVSEGALFAQSQFDALGVPTPLLGTIEFEPDAIGDQLVADFLAGQVAVANDLSRDRDVSLRELQRRAELAVVSAVQAGRGFATEESFKAAAGVLGALLHKLWVARFDLATAPCASCVRLHGQHVPLGAEFPVPDTEPSPYRSPFNGPPRHPNCRCSLVLYMPTAQSKKDVTPLSMQAYATWALSLSDEDRENYLAATIVHVKAYTRIVDGKLQHVSGYYYNIQTGQKVPAGAVGSMKVKEVSAKQAKSMAKVSKQAQVSTPKGGAPDLTWKPGTYRVDNPGDDDTQIIVHQDGSSTAIYKGITEDNDKNTTAQYLAAAKQQGKVQKISDDPDVPDPDGPGPLMEPDGETNKASTLAEGWYVLKSGPYDGLRVDADGNGELYLENFTKTLPLKPTAINQISNGNLGEFEEVDEGDFKSGWQKEFEESKAGGAKPGSDSSASVDLDPAEPGDRPVTKPLKNAPDFKSIQDVSIPEEPALPADIKYMAAGVAVIEDDGSVWIYEPKGKFAGYEHTWPKGGVEEGFSLQQTAHKELFEETGLEAEITGYLGDYKRSGDAGKFGGKVRIYVARRTGGTPLPDDPTPYVEGGSETASVKNVSFEEAKNLLNINRDKRVLKDVVEFGLAGRASAVPGAAPSGGSQDAPEATPDASEASAGIPEAPEGGPGPVIKGGPSLFSVGQHSVQIEEGSQVYKSGKSKDTLYVLQPDGDLIKYNPQGAGVQATKVGSSENPAARAQLLAGLNNATDLGVSIKNSMPQPGTGKALVGGFEMTSAQLGDAIAALLSNPSGNVVADLKKIGSPLAAGKFHEVAAPFKAYYNNKTKPALIAALKKAQAQTGFTPLSEAPAVAHMETAHGLDTSDVQLGLSDHEAIHQALHAVDPRGFDHSHAPASPGFISFSGVPVSPQAVAEGLEALQKAPKAETGIKKPLKAIGSPLSGVNLQELANTSSITDQFKGSNGKVHYGKLKPAVIALLQNALDKHQTDNPPVAPPAAVIPDPVKSVNGVSATQAQLLEMQAFWASVDLDVNPDGADLDNVAHNPLAYGVDWGALAEAKYGGIVPDSKLNAVLHEVVNDYLDKKTSPAQVASLPSPPEDTSPEIAVGSLSGSLNQFKQYKSALDSSPTSVFSDKLPAVNPLRNFDLPTVAEQLGVSSDVPVSHVRAAVSDALQKKIDQTVLETNFPPINSSDSSSVSDTLSIGGVSVSKQDLLDAVAAVQSSQTTGVKGPLKEINSPLSKVDIKAYVEADPLSDPFKGGNGKVHYGKLKAAVAAVLQAKADDMSAASAPSVPDVTPAGEADAPSAPEGDPNAFFFEGPSVTEVSGSPQSQLQKLMDNAKTAAPVFGDAFAEGFQKALKENKEYFVLDDLYESLVTATFNEVDGAFHYNFTPEGDVFSVDEMGNPNKLSDTELINKLKAAFETDGGLDDDLAELNVSDAGFYTSSGGMALKVFPNGTGETINTASGDTVPLNDPADVKTLLDLGSWSKISDTPNDPNKLTVSGVEVGTYTSGYGLPSYDVYPDGTVVLTPPAGPPVLMSVSTAKSYIVSDGLTPTPLHMDKPDWVADARLDPNGFLVGSYYLENGDTFFVTPEGPQGLSVQVVSQYLINGEATFGSEFAQPPKFTPSSPEFESLSADTSVLDPLPDPPSTATELYPDGTWEGHPVGTWANIDGETLEITEDGPLLSFDDYEDGATPDLILDMIQSGDLVWIPSADSPQPSTPSSTFDVDAPVLQPFMPSGYTKLDKVDKPELLDAAKKWAADSGFEGIAAQHLNAATKKEDLIDWLNHWSKGEWDKAYEIEAKKVKIHKKAAQHPGSPENPANTGGFTQKKMPPVVSGELPAGSAIPGSWPSGNYYSWDDEQVDAYLLASNMQNPTGLTSYQKKKWAHLHHAGDKLGTDSLSFLAQKNVAVGKINSSPILPPVQKYAPGEAVPLPADFPSIDYSKSAVKDWSNNQLDQYLNHVFPTKKIFDKVAAQSPETKAQLVALHAVSAAPSDQTTFKDPALAKKQMQDLIDKLQQNSYLSDVDAGALMAESLKVKGKTFTLDTNQPPLLGGSSSEIFQLTDESGDKYIFKVAPEKFRAEVEHAGHKLAELSGIRVADSQLGTFNGKFGQFQAKIPNKSTLQGVPVADLPLSALKDLMAAHVQDWVTANDDAHANNFLLMPDGKRVMPIDIARSFVRFGKPGSMQLKVGALSDWTNPYYDGVYQSALNKSLSDADVDELYKASMKQARRTAAVSDDAWGSTISEGLKNRPNFGWTSAKDLPDLVSQALARKNALPEDFEKFWDDIYSQLGREKPVASSSLSKWVYSGFSPEFFEQAEVMGNHGASTFFAGAALEEGSMLGQVMHKSDGGKEFHLSGQLLQGADAKLQEWLSANLLSDLSGSSYGSVSSSEQKFLADAGAVNYSSWVLSAAKTISYHHKQGDKNYNTQHIANFEAMKADVAKKISDVAAGKFPSKFQDWPEAQQEYKNLLDYYDGKLRAVQHLMDFNGQSKIGDFDPYSVSVPSPKAIESPIDLGPDLKVTKINSYFDQADLGDDGRLVLTGKDPSSPFNGWESDHPRRGQTGKTYQVTLSDGTQIEYKPWGSKDGVARAQQGQLKIKVRNYDGTSAGVDAARSALSTMGLDLQDATEEDLELLYYRHLYGVATDRMDQNKGKIKEVIDDVKENLPGGTEGTPALTAAEELKRWRAAWSRLDPAKFNTFLAKKGWMPKFMRASPSAPDQRGGQAYWERFDLDDDWLLEQQFAGHSLGDSSIALNVVKSGGLFSTEDRVKLLGQWIGGMSSDEDQVKGSANFVYSRQNQESYGTHQIYFSPNVLKRTTNYTFDYDYFGEMDYKKSYSQFDLNEATKNTHSKNELMVKRMVSLLDDIELIVFPNSALRQEAIQYLKSKGVTEIRGLPIEDRLVLSGERSSAVKKIKEHNKTWKEEDEDLF